METPVKVIFWGNEGTVTPVPGAVRLPDGRLLTISNLVACSLTKDNARYRVMIHGMEWQLLRQGEQWALKEKAHS